MPYANPLDQKAAARRHYESNREAMKVRAVQHKAEAQRRNRAYVQALKIAALCADCGVDHPPHRLQFDHLGVIEKDRNIADMVHAPMSLKRLQLEIEKCEIVCANCHADRTHFRRLTSE